MYRIEFMPVPEELIIAVQDDTAVFLHSFQNFQLGLQDALHGAKMLNVHGADVGDDSHVRAVR